MPLVYTHCTRYEYLTALILTTPICGTTSACSGTEPSSVPHRKRPWPLLRGESSRLPRDRKSIGKKRGLAIAPCTSCIASPYPHEELSSWYLQA